MRAIVQAGKSQYDAKVVRALVQALDHNDYEIQEWATVALRELRNDPAVVSALWDSFRTETRHSARSCVLIALGHLGKCLPPQELLALYRERREHPKDLILESAIRWAGRNDPSPEMLRALREIQHAELVRVRREPRLQATIATALLRAARRGLVDRKVTKPWLKEHGFTDLLDKMHETRIERMTAEETARRDQKGLPGIEAPDDGESLVPGYPLKDSQDDQYVQDLAEFKNVRLIEERSIVHDRRVAQEAKRAARFRCQACGDVLDDPVRAGRYVQAHHIEPLSEGGADIGSNVAVLCPNCHAKIHAGALRVEKTDQGLAFLSARGDSEVVTANGGRDDAHSVDPQGALRERIVALFRELNPGGREDTLRKLLAIATKDDAPDTPASL